MAPRHCPPCHTDWQSRFLSTVVPLWEKSLFDPDSQMGLEFLKLMAPCVFLLGLHGLYFQWGFCFPFSNWEPFGWSCVWPDLLVFCVCLLLCCFQVACHNLPEFVKLLLFVFYNVSFYLNVLHWMAWGQLPVPHLYQFNTNCCQHCRILPPALRCGNISIHVFFLFFFLPLQFP